MNTKRTTAYLPLTAAGPTSTESGAPFHSASNITPPWGPVAVATARGDAAPELFPEEAEPPFLSIPHPDRTAPAPARAGRVRTPRRVSRAQASGDIGVEDGISGTFQRIGKTYVAPYAPKSTTRDGELPITPHLLPMNPWGVMGSCGASSVLRPAGQAARSTRMRAKSSMAARTCVTRSPASVIAAAAASPSMPARARRCRVPSRTASSSPSRPSTA